MKKDDYLILEALRKQRLQEGTLGAAIGGGVGAAVGGPVGAAIGAGAGNIIGGSEEAEGKPNNNTLKAYNMLVQAVQLIIKASNLPNVNWDYSDEEGEVDLPNALENIKDYVGQLRF